MYKYAVGELVRIKENVFEIETDMGITPEMQKFFGGVYAVRGRCSYENAYKLEEVYKPDSTVNGDGYWMWSEEWLEPAEVSKIDVTEDDFMNMF